MAQGADTTLAALPTPVLTGSGSKGLSQPRARGVPLAAVYEGIAGTGPRRNVAPGGEGNVAPISEGNAARAVA